MTPEAQPETVAGRRIVEPDGYHGQLCNLRLVRLGAPDEGTGCDCALTDWVLAIEAEARSAALAPYREALREKVEALPFRFNNARDASLLETPPAPSDHGTLDVERLARAIHLSHAASMDEVCGYPDRPDAIAIAAEYARLAAPSVPPEETRP